jgi:hypothetical protein
MRYIFSLFLIFAIFGFAITDNQRQKKLKLIAKAIKNLRDQKEKKRVLQEAQQTSVANSTSGEDTKAEEPAKEIDKDEPVSTQGTQVGSVYSTIQVIRFHTFKAVSKVITFGVYFFFYRRPIAMSVWFRLRVTKNSRRFRNLDEDPEAESVPTLCNLTDPSLAGQMTDGGKKVDYNCRAQTEKINATISNITLNTDVDMRVVNQNGTTETVNFVEVNFKGNSSEQASSLQEVGETNPIEVNLEDVELAKQGKNSFQLKGKANPANVLKYGHQIPFKISSYDGDVATTKDITCSVTSTDESSGETILDCSGEVNTTMSDLHLSSGSTSDYTATLNVKDWENNSDGIATGQYYTGESSSHNVVYRKNSSGLSGGAIAGIVIACVVVLAAASIAAIMLRKPAPPIDNTTVVGLKTVENM